jgi:hypothetical protein
MVSAMRVSAFLAMALLSVAGCAPRAPLADEQPTFREFRPDPAPARRTARDNAVELERAPLELSPPSRGAALRSAPPPPAFAAPPPRLPDAAFSEPFTPGPITGYGLGGMQHEPGMPHNPPWN